ncbi:hypothetical protein U1Q18_035041 [Sarracenia purpurea var. burkii]
MAIRQYQSPQQNQPFLFDALYCEEEKQWEEEDEEDEEEKEEEEEELEEGSKDQTDPNGNNRILQTSVPPLFLSEQDPFWEDDQELLSLFSKEQETLLLLNLENINNNSDTAAANAAAAGLSEARKEAVDWILKVIAHFGFTTLTAILAINYLDRFLSSLRFQRDKPWMSQLAAVACLSLAAKVEETQVPLLLDLQVVEGTKYVFEAKTIQRMELLVLSTLQWRMNPVTPVSFLDYITRRLALKTHLHWEFSRRCERLLLSVVADPRFVRYLPSVLATATMLHAIHQVEPRNSIEYQNQLLGVLKISREKVNDCYKQVMAMVEQSETAKTCFYGNGQKKNPQKRKYEEIPRSPSGVIDASLSCESDSSSNESWGLVGPSVSSSPEPLIFKKSRSAQEQQMRVPSHTRVFVDIVGTPL